MAASFRIYGPPGSLLRADAQVAVPSNPGARPVSLDPTRNGRTIYPERSSASRLLSRLRERGIRGAALRENTRAEFLPRPPPGNGKGAGLLRLQCVAVLCVFGRLAEAAYRVAGLAALAALMKS